MKLLGRALALALVLCATEVVAKEKKKKGKGLRERNLGLPDDLADQMSLHTGDRDDEEHKKHMEEMEKRHREEEEERRRNPPPPPPPKDYTGFDHYCASEGIDSKSSPLCMLRSHQVCLGSPLGV